MITTQIQGQGAPVTPRSRVEAQIHHFARRMSRQLRQPAAMRVLEGVGVFAAGECHTTWTPLDGDLESCQTACARQAMLDALRCCNRLED